MKNENIIIFEDSKSGIEAAIRANVRDIVIVDSARTNLGSYNFTKIDHFDKFDRTILVNSGYDNM